MEPRGGPALTLEDWKANYLTAIEVGNEMLDKERSRADAATTRAERLSAVVADAHALHAPVWDGTVPPGGFVCRACGVPVESEPCETVRALDGELTEAERAAIRAILEGAE